jgi:regulator of protease activity HflC (stomatin/prohibitin superfamily)
MEISILIIIVVLFFIFFVRQVEQYQRGVMFTLGKFTGLKNPG